MEEAPAGTPAASQPLAVAEEKFAPAAPASDPAQSGNLAAEPIPARATDHPPEDVPQTPSFGPGESKEASAPPSPRTSGEGSAAARSTVRIAIANPPTGLRVSVDGRNVSLPLRLPRDQKPHTVVFTSKATKPETKTIVFDRDQTLTLDNRPGLYVP